jgi:hypothetical protein
LAVLESGVAAGAGCDGEGSQVHPRAVLVAGLRRPVAARRRVRRSVRPRHRAAPPKKPARCGQCGLRSRSRYDQKPYRARDEGLNNKIRVLQRRAYGYRDEEYLKLKIVAAFLPSLTRSAEQDPL